MFVKRKKGGQNEEKNFKHGNDFDYGYVNVFGS